MTFTPPFLSLFHIQIQRAYEAGTTQNARSLGGAVRYRRSSGHAKSPPPVTTTDDHHPLQSRAAAISQRATSSHALFFGTDDIATLKEDQKKEEEEDYEGFVEFCNSGGQGSPPGGPGGKKNDIEVPSGKAEEDTASHKIVGQSKSKEWTEIRDLARDVFHVYFTNGDDNNIGSGVSFSKRKMNQRQGRKNKRFYTKINGTMPSLPTYLSKLQLPVFVVKIILFVEASFRGIAQVKNAYLLGGNRHSVFLG